MFRDVFLEVTKRLDEYYERREKAIKISRDLLRLAREIINNVHNKDFDRAHQLLLRANDIVEQINSIGKEDPRIIFSGFWTDVTKELAEAAIFKHVMERKLLGRQSKLPSPGDLKISDEAWILGLCEVAGEIKREILLAVRDNNFSLAKGLLSALGEIYSLVSNLAYPHSVLPGIKSRVDYVRNILVASEELVIRMEHEAKVLENLRSKM